MYDHMLDHLHGLEWIFSQDFDVFWRENTLFLWRKIVFLRDFSEANVLKHCVFSLFLRDFLSGKKKLKQNRFRECRWSFLTRFFLWKYMILERKRVVFQQVFEPIGIQGTWFFVLFLYFFSLEKMHEHETAILYMNRDSAEKKNGVKKRVFGCSRWTLRSQRYLTKYAFLMIFCDEACLILKK